MSARRMAERDGRLVMATIDVDELRRHMQDYA
jgi:hypothetical protein